MAFAPEAVSGTSGVSQTSLTVSSFTVTSANLMLVGVAWGAASPVDSVVDPPTWNTTESFTKVASSGIDDGGIWASVVWYRLDNPSTGTHDITFDYGGYSPVQSSLHVVTFTDANLTLGAASTATNTTSDPSLTVAASASGNIVVSLCSNDNSANPTTQAGTLIYEAENIGSDLDTSAQYQTATGANTVCSWTQNASGDGWVASGFAVSAAAGGNPELDAEAGSITITGTDAGVEYGRAVVAESGAVAISGTDVTLLRGLVMDAEAGAVSISGTDAALHYSDILDAEAGSVAITGTPANLYLGRVIEADPGSVIVTGTAADLWANKQLNADPGSIIVSGSDSTSYVDRTLDASAGAVTITGTAATLTSNRILTAESGSVTITGTDAALEAGPDYAIAAESGSVIVSGTDASLAYGYLIGAEAGSVTITGTDVGLEYGGAFTADPGAVTITGTDATFGYSRIIQADPGSVVISAEETVLFYERLELTSREERAAALSFGEDFIPCFPLADSSITLEDQSQAINSFPLYIYNTTLSTRAQRISALNIASLWPSVWPEVSGISIPERRWAIASYTQVAPMTVMAQATASVTANLSIAARLSALLVAQSTATLSENTLITAGLSAAASASFALTTGIRLSANLSGQASITASGPNRAPIVSTIPTQTFFDGSVEGKDLSSFVADLDGDILIARFYPDPGTPTPTFTVNANTSVLQYSGSVVGAPKIYPGNVVVWDDGFGLGAYLPARATVTAALGTSIPLAAGLDGMASVLNTFLTDEVSFATQLFSSATIAADLTTGVVLQSQLFGEASIDATLGSVSSLSATVLGNASINADIYAEVIALDAACVAEASVVPNLTTGIKMSASLAGLSSFFDRSINLEATLLASASISGLLRDYPGQWRKEIPVTTVWEEESKPL